MSGFKAIQLITKHHVVLVAYINFDIRPLVLVEYFKFITYPYRQEELIGLINAWGIVTGKLYRVPVDAGYFAVNYTQFHSSVLDDGTSCLN